jgi:hypothetical protein
MQVINKSRFFFFAGFLVSTISLSKVIDSTKLAPSTTNSAKVDIATENNIREAEVSFKNERLKNALTELRQNVNLSTAELLTVSGEL